MADKRKPFGFSILAKSKAVIRGADSGNRIWGSSNGAMSRVAAGGGVEYYTPRWFSPMLSWVHFYMPTDLKTTYTWLRHWDVFQPIVGNAIDLHTQLPLSRFSLKVSDPIPRKVYQDMMESCGGLLLMYGMLRDYWLLGESFVYLFWDEEAGMFTDAQLLPPEDLIVDNRGWLVSGVDGVEYKLQIAQKSFNPEINPLDRAILDKMPLDMLEAIQKGKPVPLSPYFVMPLQRKQSPYMRRGSSIVLRTMKDLLYEDKLREAQYAIAQRFISPKEIWRIGSDTFPATDAQIEDLESAVKQAGQQPLFTLVTNHTVSLEYVTGAQSLGNIQGEFQWIENRVLTAMFINKALTHAEGPTYANASVALRVLMERYMFVRSMLEKVFMERFFLPVAVVHEFYKITPAELSHGIRRPFSEREPILPEFDWRHKVNLLDTTTMISMVNQMRQLGFPMKIICDVLGVDYEEAKYWKQEEEGGIFDTIYEEWRKRTMTNLPSPVGPAPAEGAPARGASFKIPVKIGEKQISKDTKEPIVEEMEFEFPDKQNILAKAEYIKRYVAPYLKKKEPVPAEHVFDIEPDDKDPKTKTDLSLIKLKKPKGGK